MVAVASGPSWPCFVPPTTCMCVCDSVSVCVSFLRGVLLKEDWVLWPITEDGCETAACLAPAAPTHTPFTHTHINTQVESVAFLQQAWGISCQVVLLLYIENIGPIFRMWSLCSEWGYSHMQIALKLSHTFTQLHQRISGLYKNV